MDRPTITNLAFNTRLKTFAAEFLNERRREKRRDDGKAFVWPERIDSFPDFRKWLDPLCQDRANIKCFEFARAHVGYSSQRFRRSPAKLTSMTDQMTAILMNQTPACVIHQLARGVLFAASEGIC